MRLSDSELGRLRKAAGRIAGAVADLAATICAVPAPTYHEADRARLVAQLFRERGLEPEIDEINNVYARRPGAGRAPALMLLGHTDTVFPPGIEISITRRNGSISGPGIGDNSLGVAALLGLIELLDSSGTETAGDLLLVANVGEEGLGNLRGARAAVDRFASELGAVIAVEGHNLGRVTTGAVGSKRIEVTVAGPGGHSWGAFGQPSAIHALGHIIHEIDLLDVASDPKTTYNVGVIEGGVSVNTIAPNARAIIDMRSISVESLADLSRRVEEIITRQRTDHISTSIEVLGERPAGETSRDEPIVQAAVSILRELNLDVEIDASSTDANVPIARGIPAVCIGITRGSGTHRLEESIEVEPIELGMTQLAMLSIAHPFEARSA
jgi:tripeptide aminopeptidase